MNTLHIYVYNRRGKASKFPPSLWVCGGSAHYKHLSLIIGLSYKANLKAEVAAGIIPTAREMVSYCHEKI